MTSAVLIQQQEVKAPKKYQQNILDSILEDSSYQNFAIHHSTSAHVAVLVKRGKIISVGLNKIGTRSKSAAHSFITIHAERNCIRQLGDLNEMRGAELYVVQVPRKQAGWEEGKFLRSKPCDGCQKFLEKCIREYGLKKVYYSDGSGCTGPSKCSVFARNPLLRIPSISSRKSPTITEEQKEKFKQAANDCRAAMHAGSRPSSPTGEKK
jgi:hypothetical protein